MCSSYRDVPKGFSVGTSWAWGLSKSCGVGGMKSLMLGSMRYVQVGHDCVHPELCERCVPVIQNMGIKPSGPAAATLKTAAAAL